MSFARQITPATAAAPRRAEDLRLTNVAALCHNSDGGEGTWPALVSEHVRRILAAMNKPSPLDTLGQADVLDRVFLRLVGASSLPEQARGWYQYGRLVCGDLLELIALDEPETVRYLRDEDVERIGLDDLRAAGLENLLREPIEVNETLNARGGVKINLVMGESVWTASKLLVLPDVLRRAFGEREYPHGLLAAVPYRHQLAFYPIEGANLVTATEVMAGFAAQGFSEGVGPLSPFLYWWRDGELTQLSFFDNDGTLTVRADEEFGDLLNRLASGSE